jgi:hypothetical protein
MVCSLESPVERTAVILNVAKQHLPSVAVLLPANRKLHHHPTVSFVAIARYNRESLSAIFLGARRILFAAPTGIDKQNA